MSEFKGPNGTLFTFRHAEFGHVIVSQTPGVDGDAQVDVADLLAFADDVRREYGKGLDLTPGPIVAVDDDGERREFIRRAAIAFFAQPYQNPNASGHNREHWHNWGEHEAWMNAKALWDAKPEDC